MKKSILIVITLLVCIIKPIMAWDYFIIYFQDGTQSEKFYVDEVDSICYSKIGIDSVLYTDWQIQEIWTADSTYRYSLSRIDSISFVKVDIDELAQNIAVVSNWIAPLYINSKSATELYEKVSANYDTTIIEKIWGNDEAVYVQIKNWRPIVYLYPPTPTDDIPMDLDLPDYSPNISRRADGIHNCHQFINAKKACVVNQQYLDEDPYREDRKYIAGYIDRQFKAMGIESEVINMPKPDFFIDAMFDYDIAFLITHGFYDNEGSWFFTGEELYKYEWHLRADGKYVIFEQEENMASDQAKMILEKKYKNKKYIDWGCVPEYREGKLYNVYYTCVSDGYIAESSKKFRSNAIVFNAACHSFEDDVTGWIFTQRKGAGCYLGYDNSNFLGQLAGAVFFVNMLNGNSAKAAYLKIPSSLLHEHHYKYKYQGEDGWCFFYDEQNFDQNTTDGRVVNLKMIPKESLLCLTHTITYPLEDNSDATNMKVTLRGGMKTLRHGDTGNTVGFQYSTSPDMTEAKTINVDDKTFDETTHSLIWKATLDEKDLQPNTTYYYRAYMNDSQSNCYGEIKQFTTGIPDNYEAYTVLANDTITFYYDDKCKKRQGHICNRTSNGERFLHLNYNKGWLYHIKTAKFDPSFANYYATNMSGCFAYCTNMTEIIDIKYLKTDSVTDMREMFSDCRSLKNIDLSHFNTSKVKDMSRMFYVCWSLNSLDLSSFNTSNVTNMSLMFYECRALENLDLSSFNTTKVTNMHMMFEYCNSLTKLDLSSFNPINVTDMGNMFYECSSMTNLKFGNFNTANVTNMYMMFSNCKSLTSLDLSSFNTINVTNMTFMFRGCNSLTNLNLSSFNTSNVTNMGTMFGDCSSLTSLDLSSFNTSNISEPYGDFFSGCSSLHKIYVSSNWKQLPGPYMFYDCIKLEGGKGTKIGKNFYGYDDKGNPLYYNCGYDSSVAHIDGGKDNPGLFTAK